MPGRKHLSVSVVKEIEKVCDKTIEIFGYNKTFHWSIEFGMFIDFV